MLKIHVIGVPSCKHNTTNTVSTIFKMHIGCLPAEILEHIFQCHCAKDLLHTSLVCKQFFAVIWDSHRDCWLHIFFNNYASTQAQFFVHIHSKRFPFSASQTSIVRYCTKPHKDLWLNKMARFDRLLYHQFATVAQQCKNLRYLELEPNKCDYADMITICEHVAATLETLEFAFVSKFTKTYKSFVMPRLKSLLFTGPDGYLVMGGADATDDWYPYIAPFCTMAPNLKELTMTDHDMYCIALDEFLQVLTCFANLKQVDAHVHEPKGNVLLQPFKLDCKQYKLSCYSDELKKKLAIIFPNATIETHFCCNCPKRVW